MELKNELTDELIFVALSEPENIKCNIYGEILAHLTTKFSRIHVICLSKKRKNKRNKEIITEDKIRYYSGNPLHWFSFFNKIKLKKVRFIFLTDFFIGGLISLFYAKANKIPLVYRCGGPWKYDLNSPSRILKHFIISITKPLVLKNCQKVVYNSKAIIQKKYRHNYEVIYNGVDTKLFRPMKVNKRSTKLNILYVGRIFHEKGIKYLLKAVKGLEHKVHLGLVGDGELLLVYKNKYPFAEFYGRLPKSELPKIINQYDILMLPSLVESFPNVLLEAMACGKPVIATKIFGIPEMVTAGENGFLVPPKNSKAIRAALDHFIQNPKLIQQMGTRARKIMEEKFEKKKQMDYLIRELFQ